MKRSSKESLTQNERLQIAGLLVLAQQARKQCDLYSRALEKVTGELDYTTGEPLTEGGGHCGDAVWNDYTADELIEKLGLKVVD